MLSREKKLKYIAFSSVTALLAVGVLFGSLAFAQQESSSSFSRPSLLVSSPKKIVEDKPNTDLNENNKIGEKVVGKENASTRKNISKNTNKKSNKKTTQKNNSFTVKMLPISHGDWILNVKNMHSPDKKQCVAVNSVSVIDDGYSGSSVTVEVTANAIHIYTESIVDVSYLDMGIAVDKFDRVDIDSIFSETNVAFNFHVDQLIAQMHKGDTAVLTLGFWPSWPMTHTYSTDISLSGFSKIMNKLGVCDKKIT